MNFVRHRAKPEWGVGRIIDSNAETIRIQFPHGIVTLKTAIAEKHLEEVTADDVGREQKSRAAPTKRTPEVSPSRPCITCADALGLVRRSADDGWRSCPNCSVEDGRQHIFRPYPGAFGEQTDEVSGREQYCRACREGTARTGPFRRCSQLVAAAVGVVQIGRA